MKCILPGVRVKADIDPTRKFTTNVSESINHVIKQEVDWKENKLPVLIDHLKAITKQHVAELEKAVIGRGEWNFTTVHKHLQIPDTTWFSMNLESKEKHMKKVQSCKVTKKMVSTSCSSSVSTLSIPVEECGVTTVAPSIYTLNNIWKKAANLVTSEGHILNAPWLSDEKARLVKSSSSPHPRIIKTQKNKKLYCCDDNCVMFKGFSLCAHVAVAEHNGDLRSFLDSVSATCGPNLTAIANQECQVVLGERVGYLNERESVQHLCSQGQYVRALSRILSHLQIKSAVSLPYQLLFYVRAHLPVPVILITIPLSVGDWAKCVGICSRSDPSIYVIHSSNYYMLLTIYFSSYY